MQQSSTLNTKEYSEKNIQLINLCFLIINLQFFYNSENGTKFIIFV